MPCEPNYFLDQYFLTTTCDVYINAAFFQFHSILLLDDSSLNISHSDESAQWCRGWLSQRVSHKKI